MVYIFGHKKPDTDAVTSAIALSYLKNELGIKSEPRILGDINKETSFVLDYFNVETPKLLEDVKLQIKDIKYYKDCYLNGKSSINRVYKYMMESNITGVPLTDDNNSFKGLLTTKMIGKELISGNFNLLNTSYDNILEVLKGEEILKFDNEINGEIIAASYRSTTFLHSSILKNNTIMIVGDRHSLIEEAVNSGIKLLIIVGSLDIKDEHLKIAQKNKVNVIKTHYDTFTTAKLINLSNYAYDLLENVRNVSFTEDDYYTEFRDKCLKLGYNNYPILDHKGYCKGLIRITDINDMDRKQVILVDHNESSQSVDGLDEAEILEVVDHHKIGSITTTMPINFRNMAVGSTNTILFSMFNENNIEIPSTIAGLMLSGILSDTLKFTSPTTTEYDKYVGNRLAFIAGVNIDEYAKEMFTASSDLNGKTIEEIISSDLKVFEEGNKRIAISQIILLDTENLLKQEDEYIKEINRIKTSREYDMLVVCVTDIIKNGSYIYYDSDSEDLIKDAFDDDKFKLGTFKEGFLSRKKQVVPIIMRLFK
mgnify:CR=1 FL=1